MRHSNRLDETSTKSPVGVSSVFTIYCHTHIESGRRYVGLTKLTMMKRWNRHVYDSKSKKGKGCVRFWNAIRKYGKDSFSHEVLETCKILEVANLAEESWISFFDSTNPEKGFNLMSSNNYSPHPVSYVWDRPGFREGASLRSKEVWGRPGFREEQSSIMKSVKSTNDSKQRSSSASKKLWSDPNFRSDMSDMLKKKYSDPVIREKISSSLCGRALSPEHCQKLGDRGRGKPLTEEHRKKISSSTTGRVFSPEHRLNMSIGQRGKVLSSETKAKIGAAARAAAQARKLQSFNGLYLCQNVNCRFGRST